MRGFVLFLVAASLGGAAFAQLPGAGTAPGMALAGASTGNAAGAPELNAEGKIKLGFEGRGNYRKPEFKLPKATAIAAVKKADPMTEAMAATTVSGIPTAAIPVVAKDGLRSDSALKSDSSKMNNGAKLAQARADVQNAINMLDPAKDQGNNAAPLTTNTTNAATAAASPTAAVAPASTNNARTATNNLNTPLVIVGGKLVRPE